MSYIIWMENNSQIYQSIFNEHSVWRYGYDLCMAIKIHEIGVRTP